MPNDPHDPQLTQQRKNALIAQAASYRAGVTRSKDAVKANLHADALALSAAQHLAARASTVAGALLGLNGLRNGNLRALVPLVGTGVSWLAKRNALGPMARGAVALAAIGAGAFFLIHKKRAARAASVQPDQSAQSE